VLVIAFHLEYSTRSNFLIHLRIFKRQDQLCGLLQVGFFRIIKVRHIALGKPERENRPRLRAEENQRSEAARLSSSGPRDPLLDKASPQIGVDLTTFCAPYSLTKHRVRDFLLSGKLVKPAVFENPHATFSPLNV